VLKQTDDPPGTRRMVGLAEGQTVGCLGAEQIGQRQ
jgi:hypothetical protein